MSETWKCEAANHNASMAGASDPTDCDFPFCGCDPGAAKVIEALHEAGWGDGEDWRAELHDQEICIQDLRAKLSAAETQRDALANFAREIIRMSWDGGVDGFDVEATAKDHGLILLAPATQEEAEAIADVCAGDEIPKFAPWLAKLSEKLRGAEAERDALKASNETLMAALEFYAAPETYFAVAFLADNPAGAICDDFEEPNPMDPVWGEYWDGVNSAKPGKLARQVMAQLIAAISPEPAPSANAENGGTGEHHLTPAEQGILSRALRHSVRGPAEPDKKPGKVKERIEENNSTNSPLSEAETGQKTGDWRQCPSCERSDSDCLHAPRDCEKFAPRTGIARECENCEAFIEGGDGYGDGWCEPLGAMTVGRVFRSEMCPDFIAAELAKEPAIPVDENSQNIADNGENANKISDQARSTKPGETGQKTGHGGGQ
jgi:hypothetical protein